MTEQFRPRGFRLLPTIVKNLLIINGLFFLAQMVSEKTFGVRLEDYLGLHYPAAQMFKPWQFLTYMFLHGSFGHIFFNMFALWMFGYALENVWGPRRFLLYYLVTGIGAGIVHSGVVYLELRPALEAIRGITNDPSASQILSFVDVNRIQISQQLRHALINDPTNRQVLQDAANFFVDYREHLLNMPNVIGASGAVFGILLAFWMLFPNALISIYFLFPINSKYFLIIDGALELFLGVSGTASNIAHFAHLGGMIFGFFLIRYWKKKGNLY